MIVLGLQGSPRKNGNTAWLLNEFMEHAKKQYGAKTTILEPGRMSISPCIECSVCSEKGYCPFDDDMRSKALPLIKEADVIIAGTPIFFYNAPAQFKSFIDRSQELWSRHYRLGLKDPGRASRKGFLLAVGATKGANLFDGMRLTAKYFFDAIGSDFSGDLTYRRIEDPGDMGKHPQVRDDITKAAKKLFEPIANKKTILFAGKQNAAFTQAAWAFAQAELGREFQVLSAGTAPAKKIDCETLKALETHKIDMAFITPKSFETVLYNQHVDFVVNIGCESLPDIMQESSKTQVFDWKPESTESINGFIGSLEQRIDQLKKIISNPDQGL